MRRLNVVFFLFFLRLAHGTLASSLLGIKFSRGLKADKLQISYLGALQDIFWNGTGRLLGNPLLHASRDDYVELAAPITEAFHGTLTLMPSHLIKLKFRASRTIKASSDGDGNCYGSAPSKVFGHPTAAIDLFISLYLWKSLAAVGFILAIGLAASLRGILKAIESLEKTWYAFSAGFDAFVIFAMERVLIASRRLLCFIDIYIGSLTIHLSKLWSDLVFLVSGLLGQARIRQWQERHTFSITRKKVNSPAKFRRPYGKHSRTPLFRRDVYKKLTYKFLPEEPNKSRHMSNPLYFNQVKKVGAGAFGSVYQIENRITGRMMAMKSLVRTNTTDDDFDMEIRALARLQGDVWYPKLSSTFMDVKHFYILMVCSLSLGVLRIQTSLTYLASLPPG